MKTAFPPRDAFNVKTIFGPIFDKIYFLVVFCEGELCMKYIHTCHYHSIRGTRALQLPPLGRNPFGQFLQKKQ